MGAEKFRIDALTEIQAAGGPRSEERRRRRRGGDGQWEDAELFDSHME